MNGSRYRTYFLSANRDSIEAALRSAFDRISQHSKCAIKDVETKIFGRRAWGTWTQTAMIVDILASSGLITYINRFEIELSPGSNRAANKLLQHEFNILGGIKDGIRRPIVRSAQDGTGRRSTWASDR